MSGSPTFDEYFEAVHGFGPFPWQQLLAERIADGRPPSSITAPPGLGKTAALDAWLWALAVDISRNGSGRTIPLRAVFVVDRRGIVDAAHQHAQGVADELAEGSDPAVAWVAEQLRSSGFQLQRPLEVVKMRGGVSWASRWLRQPDQPAVISGTVDQFGSRFLFRGYGTSERMRPIDAALVGTDVIAFLDEAHLSPALVSTVRDCAAMEGRHGGMSSRQLSIVPMTATPGVEPTDSDSLGITADDRSHPVAGPRINAQKGARLVEVPTSAPAKANDEMARALAAEAAEAAERGQVALVVCNTIGVARAVHKVLTTGRTNRVDTRLSIGRGREIDKTVSTLQWWDEARAWRLNRLAPRTSGLVIVSTQTIEVGADLDVDTLITEAAPLDALIQRFGRVDRLGEVGATSSVILYHPVRSDPERDLIYGAATEATWRWLEAIAVRSEPDGSSEVGMGVAELRPHLESLSPGNRSALLAPLPKVPLLYPDLVDQLARTDPTNGVQFPVDAYLHGLARPELKVSVVWRADLEHGDDIAARLSSIPPTTAEAVDVPLEHFRRFWTQAKTPDVLSDLETTATPLEEDKKSANREIEFTCWAIRDGGEVLKLNHPAQVRPGELIVVPSSAGGHDEFGWAGADSDSPVPDVADLVSAGMARLRVDEMVLGSLGIHVAEVPAIQRAMVRLNEVMSSREIDDTKSKDQIDELLRALVDGIGSSRYFTPLSELISKLRSVHSWSTTRSTDSGWIELVEVGESAAPRPGGDSNVSLAVVLHAPRLGRGRGLVDTSMVIDTEDSLGTSLTGTEVRLDQHLGAVAQRAAEYSEHLGLPPEAREALRIAGRLHDLGKIDERFQTLLRGGDWLTSAAQPGELEPALAKSVTKRRRKPVPVPDEWKWPRGMRHEAVSLALLRQFDLPPAVDRELVEHLVASHHGWSRPLFPAVLDDNARKLDVEFDGQRLTAQSDDALGDWSSVGRFHRLCHRYGWWGLAALETVLRLADMAVSEEGS